MNYNVLTEPWIPARHSDGSVREYGVLELLEHAHELVEITDAMPNYEFGMYRFLFVFLMDAYHPKRQRDIRALLEKGSFDMNVIREYVDRCNQDGERFDLLDEKHPFMQQSEGWDKKEKEQSPAKLNPVLPSGNNHVHFDHRSEFSVTLTLPEAVRSLVSLNVFCALGGKGYQPTISSSIGSIPVYSIVIGNNLFETLIFGMLPIEAEKQKGDSSPIWRVCWEIDKEYTQAKIPLLFGLTYPVRAVKVFENNGVIDRIYYSPGLKYSKEITVWNDPYVSYVYNIKKERFEALCGDKARDQWRDIGVLFDCLKKASDGNAHTPTAPAVIQQYLGLERPLIHVHSYTLFNDQATYEKMNRDEYVFSCRILQDAIRYEFLVAVGLAVIEEEGTRLDLDLHQVHNAVLKIKKESPEAKKRKSPAIDSEHKRTMGRYYYDARQEFFKFLYPKIEEVSIDCLGTLQKEWKTIIQKIKRKEYNEFVDRVSDSSNLLLIVEKTWIQNDRKERLV